jgi:ABC-type transport system substrate-binding protein
VIIRQKTTRVVFNTLIIGTGLLFLAFFGEKASAKKPQPGGVFRLKSFSDEFRQQLDPAQPGAYIFISEQIFDGLVKLDKKLNVVPGLAEYWTISQDGRVYTFYLRRGVKFHNGQECLASDVKYSFERLLDPKARSPYYQHFLNRVVGGVDFRVGRDTEVRGFRVLGKHVFQIEWTHPYVSALYLLSTPFCKILPRDLMLKQGKKFFYRPIGTGPFVFDSWIRNARLDIIGIRLKRNKNYFLKPPYVSMIEFCPFFTLDQFVNQEIDSIPVLSEKLLNNHFQIFVDGSVNVFFLGMSCHLPPFDRKKVRQAISLVIDRQDLINELEEARYLREPSFQFVPPRLPGFFPQAREVSPNLEKADSLLKEAGFDNLETNVDLFLPWPRSDFKIKFYRALRHQLNSLGLKINLKYYRNLEEVKSSQRPYFILLQELMTIPDPETIIRPLFQSNSYFNLIHYSNIKIDELLKKASIQRSWSKRIKIFHQIESILKDEMPAIPLYNQQNRVAMQPYVRGVEIPVLGFYYLDTRKIWLDKE